jgi:hypothetical protein
MRVASFQGRFVEPAIRDATDRANGRHSLDVLGRAIELFKSGSAGTRSRNEVLFLRLDLPQPLVNTKLLGFELDFLWPEQRLNVEVDGAQHNSPAVRRADAARDRILTAAGYTVLRFPRTTSGSAPTRCSERFRVGVQPRASACGLSTPLTKRPLDGAARNSA